MDEDVRKCKINDCTITLTKELHTEYHEIEDHHIIEHKEINGNIDKFIYFFNFNFNCICFAQLKIFTEHDEWSSKHNNMHEYNDTFNDDYGIKNIFDSEENQMFMKESSARNPEIIRRDNALERNVHSQVLMHPEYIEESEELPKIPVYTGDLNLWDEKDTTNKKKSIKENTYSVQKYTIIANAPYKHTVYKKQKEISKPHLDTSYEELDIVDIFKNNGHKIIKFQHTISVPALEGNSEKVHDRLHDYTKSRSARH